MNRSLCWGLGVLASLALQVGCCSIHVDHAGRGCRPSAPCVQDVCMDDSACGINGLHHIGHLFGTVRDHVACSHTCANGCGEVYWDESINEPRTCDHCGYDNAWTGGCGHCRPWHARLNDLWGYRYIPSNGSGCDACSHGSWPSAAGAHEVIESMDEEIVLPSEHGPSSHSSLKREGVPTPARPRAGSTEGIPASRPVPAREAAPSAPSTAKSTSRPTGSGVRTDRHAAQQAMEAGKKIRANPASGRVKLTTQRG